MRDGIAFARRGIPAVALITEKFWAQSQFIGRSAGIPDLPRLMLPYPVAGEAESVIDAIAVKYARTMLGMLRPPTTPEPQ